jgi:hypothetical protein
MNVRIIMNYAIGKMYKEQSWLILRQNANNCKVGLREKSLSEDSLSSGQDQKRESKHEVAMLANTRVYPKVSGLNR